MAVSPTFDSFFLPLGSDVDKAQFRAWALSIEAAVNGVGGGASPAKGTISVGNGSAFAGLLVGANGAALVADSAQTLGVKWISVREVLAASRTYYVRTAPVTVTVTIASPGVVSWTAHGLQANDPVVFNTTGALPTGLTAGTVYFVKTVIDANSFTVSATAGGAVIATTGSQSGTHSAQTGNDSNSGLAQTRAGAMLTLQSAIDAAAALDGSIYDINVQAANSVYLSGAILKAPLGSGQLLLIGDTTTPANCLISTTSASCVAGTGYIGKWAVRGFKLQTTGTGHAFRPDQGAFWTFRAIDFGVCASGHITATALANVVCNGAYAISGGATRHMWAETGAEITIAAQTITVSNTPAFSSAFAFADIGGIIQANNNTYPGSGATGKRYDIQSNGTCFVNGAGANYFPGNAAGSVDAFGGQYL